MKKLWKNQLFVGIVLILAAAATNHLIHMSYVPSGRYQISSFQTNEYTTSIINLKNTSTAKKEGLLFKIDYPGKLHVKSKGLITYRIQENLNDSTNAMLIVDNLLPNEEGSIFLVSSFQMTDIDFINSDILSFRSEEELANRYISNFWGAALTMGLLSCSLLVYYFLAKRETKAVKKDLRRNYKDMSDIRQKLLQYDKINKKVVERQTKQRIIWQSRIREYDREINFWRTTFAKVLYQDRCLNPKTLFEEVRKSLKTYSTGVNPDKMLTDHEMSYISQLENAAKFKEETVNFDDLKSHST